METQAIIDETRRWIASFVIGLQLCPFAQRVFDADRIRYAVTDASDEATLLDALGRELKALAAMPRTSLETTLLIHPGVFADFLDYNDFFDSAEDRLTDLGLVGIIQIAGFHPGYQFEDTERDAVENYTNRSPYPMLHLLREASVSEVTAGPDDLDIPRRNIETLRRLGLAEVLVRLRAVAAGQLELPGKTGVAPTLRVPDRRDAGPADFPT